MSAESHTIPCWLKRALFMVVSHTIVFLEGYYLYPLGWDWLLPTLAITIFLAILWMLEFWRCEETE